MVKLICAAIALAMVAGPALSQDAPKAPLKPITLTEEDVNDTVRLFDLACKSGGLAACQSALGVLGKIQTQIKEAPAKPGK